MRASDLFRYQPKPDYLAYPQVITNAKWKSISLAGCSASLEKIGIPASKNYSPCYDMTPVIGSVP